MDVVRRDPALDALLLLHGETFVADAEGLCWVKFVVLQVDPTPERPHGLSYSITLHDDKGHRILGFDNAHSVREHTGPGAPTRIEFDHTHLGKRVRFYSYTDAATLLSDFWTEVDLCLKRRSHR
jgi:hypothetical protein